MLLGVAVVLGIAVLLLVPRHQTRMTAGGGATMYIFMLHLFPVSLIRAIPDAFSWFHTVRRYLLLILLAVGWSAFLFTGLVRKVFRPLVEPRVEWLFRSGSGSF